MWCGVSETRWRRGREENEQQAALLSSLSAVSASSIGTGNICVCEERVGGWDLSAVITSEAPGVAARSERAGREFTAFRRLAGSPLKSTRQLVIHYLQNVTLIQVQRLWVIWQKAKMKLLTSRLSSGALYNNPCVSCLSVTTLHLLTWNSANKRIMKVISSVWYSNHPLTYLWFAEILTAGIISWWQGWRSDDFKNETQILSNQSDFVAQTPNLTRGTIACEHNPGSVYYSHSNIMRKTNKLDIPTRQSCGWRSFIKEVQRCNCGEFSILKRCMWSHHISFKTHNLPCKLSCASNQ